MTKSKVKKPRKPAPPGQGRAQTPEAYSAMAAGRIESGISRIPGMAEARAVAVAVADEKGPATQRTLELYESANRIKHAEARIKEAAANEAELAAAEKAKRVRPVELFDRWTDDLIAAIRSEVLGFGSLVAMQGLSPEAQAGAQRVITEGTRRLLQRIAALPAWDAIK